MTIKTVSLVSYTCRVKYEVRKNVYESTRKCPSADWRAMGSLSAPWVIEDLVPLIAMMVALRREKLSLHLIQLIVLLYVMLFFSLIIAASLL